VIDQGSDRIHS